VRQADGKLAPDFTVIDRYLDLVVKYQGRIPAVIAYISEADSDGRPWITELDPATGQLLEARGPKWGTPEARDFWKPAFDELTERLARRGMASSLALGTHGGNGVGPVASGACISDLAVIAPTARWTRHAHFWTAGSEALERGPNGIPWGRVAVWGYYGNYWDPGEDKPIYGWQNPHPIVLYPRSSFMDGSDIFDYRVCAESVLLSGRRRPYACWGGTDYAGVFGSRNMFLGVRGFGPWGADFFSILFGPDSIGQIIGRYQTSNFDGRCGWITVMLNNANVTCLMGAGKNSPVASVRLEALREGLQEAEARVFVQNALLNEETRSKLGPDLARRGNELCDRRSRILRHLADRRGCGFVGGGWTEFTFDPVEWLEESQKLYDLAADISKTLAEN
jgi:hypothetical protein